MAFRRRTGRRPVGTRKRAIWINIPFGSVAFTEAAGNQALVVAEDWEAQFSGLANETAVLRAIVGDVTIQQTTVGTAGTTGFWGIYIADNNNTTAPAFTVAGMSELDWLHVGAFGTAGTLVTATGAQPINSLKVATKARRRLKSRDTIYIVGQYGADAAAPAASLGGLLRFLIARD